MSWPRLADPPNWLAGLFLFPQDLQGIDWTVRRAMDKQHPHFGATYEIARHSDDTFRVGVTVPGTQLVNVRGFTSEETAKAWVVNHERNIAMGTELRAKLYAAPAGSDRSA